MEKKSKDKVVTFEKTGTSLPLAQVFGGIYNKKIIYLDKSSNNETDLVVDNIYHHLTEKDIRKHKKYMSKEELEKIRIAFETGEIDDQVEDIYNELVSQVEESVKKHVHVDDGIFQVLPLLKENQTDRIMVTGASGSGKSTWIANYITQYNKLFPNNKIILFSRLSEDKVLDELNLIKRVKLDKTFLKFQYVPKDFKDTLAIFDDIDTFDDKALCLAVKQLRDDLLETGRHENTYVIGVSHQILNWKSTKTLLLECNKVVFFPQSGGEYQLVRLFKNYFGLMPDNIKMIKRINSHWICLNRSFPTTVIAEKDIYII